MERREQNKALKDWVELKTIIEALDPVIVGVLHRATHDSGRRRVIGDDPQDLTHDISYADPTGDTAVKIAMRDRVEMQASEIVKNINTALNITKSILSITPQDVEERALREVPDCLACETPAHGRIKSGYCETCYKAWTRAGRPERHQFELSRREQIDAEVGTLGTTEWRIDYIDTLQEQNSLPTASVKSENASDKMDGENVIKND